jgi:hypothetical protein
MKKLAFRYALRMFAGFAGLFLIMHIFGLSEMANLRVLNGLIHFAFLYLAIRAYRREYPESVGNYMTGVAIGMYSSVIAVALFMLAMSIFLGLNEPFFEKLKLQSPWPDYFTPFTATLFIFVEGIVVGLIGSYIVTRVVDAQLEKA